MLESLGALKYVRRYCGARRENLKSPEQWSTKRGTGPQREQKSQKSVSLSLIRIHSNNTASTILSVTLHQKQLTYMMPVQKGNRIFIAEGDISAKANTVEWQQSLSHKSDTYYMVIFTNEDQSVYPFF